MNAAATKLPVDVGAIHFVGIGGIGMSGIAEVLLDHGYSMQGLGPKEIQDHRAIGNIGCSEIFEGQRGKNLEGAEVIVISSAIKPGNAELRRGAGQAVCRLYAGRKCWPN